MVSLQLDNDFFGGGTDRHFTHGTRILFLTEPIRWFTEAANKLPWFHIKTDNNCDSVLARGGISVGQNIYTPEQTGISHLIKDDRPYAGWLYFGLGLVANQGSKRYDQLELNLGMIGPLSFAEEVQKGWHGFLDLPKLKGWGNQLENEPGVVLFYEQARRLGNMELTDGLKLDLIPRFGGSLGNVFTFASGGLTIRIGNDLEGDFGPPRIRPSLPGAGFFRVGEGFTWYLFAGVEGRAVIHNIFLDGNTFRSSHSVDKRHWVGDIQAGLSIQIQNFRITYTQIFRTEEFKGQDSPDKFGALSLSCQF
jgi:hypothetical protein